MYVGVGEHAEEKGGLRWNSAARKRLVSTKDPPSREAMHVLPLQARMCTVGQWLILGSSGQWHSVLRCVRVRVRVRVRVCVCVCVMQAKHTRCCF